MEYIIFFLLMVCLVMFSLYRVEREQAIHSQRMEAQAIQELNHWKIKYNEVKNEQLMEGKKYDHEIKVLRRELNNRKTA